MRSATGLAENRMGIAGSEYLPDTQYHRGLTASPGADSLSLFVGGIGVRLDGFSQTQVETLSLRYGAFCARPPTGAGIELEIDVRKAGRSDFLRVRQQTAGVELYRVDLRWEAGALLATSYEWAGWLDPQAGLGGLALADSALSEPRAFDRSLENFLRVVYAHLALRRGGFLLHAAGLVRDGRAYLFFGPSGSGKTTVTRLTPEALVLSDDLIMVLRQGAGDYVACSIPFRGVFAPRYESLESYPIAGFFRLVQDSVDRLEPLAGSRAVGQLVGSLPFVTERAEGARLAIDAAAGAARSAPVYRLRFRKDRTFWQVIDATCQNRSKIDDFSGVRGIKS